MVGEKITPENTIIYICGYQGTIDGVIDSLGPQGFVTEHEKNLMEVLVSSLNPTDKKFFKKTYQSFIFRKYIITRKLHLLIFILRVFLKSMAELKARDYGFD